MMTIFESSFTKLSWKVHPTILPFITAMAVKGRKTKVLRAYVAPVKYNVLNEAKAINIAHTMMGNFIFMAMRARFCRWDRWVTILI
jgi:hypothetical protein